MDRRGASPPSLLGLAGILLAMAGLSTGCQQAEPPELARAKRKADANSPAAEPHRPGARPPIASPRPSSISNPAAREGATTAHADRQEELALALATPDELPPPGSEQKKAAISANSEFGRPRPADSAPQASRSAPAARPYSRLAGLGPFRRELDLADELAKLVPNSEAPSAALSSAPRVLLRTTFGEIEIELDPQHAPQTVARFLKSLTSGQYDGSIFHQVVPGYIVLGGGFRADLSEIPAATPIPNEAHNGQRNRLGTVAMARPLDAVHSATGQFFFNLADNPMLDHRGGSAESFGYTVFGQVVEGLDVLQQIAEVETQDTERFEFLPVEPVVIEQAELIPTAVEPQSRTRAADSLPNAPREARR